MALALISLVLAVLAIAWLVAQQLCEKPRLRIELSPWDDPGLPWKFAAVQVLNLSLSPAFAWLFNRRPAAGCEVNISFRRPDEEQPRIAIPGRWSARPEPIRIEAVPGPPPTVTTMFDPSLVPGSYQLDIPATGASQQVALAVWRDGETYAFSSKSYAHHLWRHPRWRLEPGDWEVVVAAASADASANRRLWLRVNDDGCELFADRPADGGQPNGGQDASSSPKAEAEAAELAQEALDSERKSAENLGGRGAWLIGFVGVVLALVVGLGADLLSRRGHHPENLGKVGGPVFAGFALAAVFALLTTAFIALRSVRPRERDRMPMNLLRDLLSGALPVEEARSEVAHLKVGMYQVEARSNDERGQQLQRALRVLILGLTLVSGLAVILFLHQAKVW